MKRILGLAIAVIFVAPYVIGQNNAFAEAVDAMVAANQRMTIDIYEMHAELLERKADNMLSPLEIGGSYEHGTKGVGDKIGAEISQGFDWPGVYTARRRAIKNQSEAYEQFKEGRLRDVRMDAALALIDYVSAKRILALRMAMLERLDDTERYYTTAFSHGETTILDVNKVKIARLNALRDLSDSKTQLAVAEASVATFASGCDLSGLLSKVDTFDIAPLRHLDAYVEEARSSDPKLRHLELSAKTAVLDVTAVKRGNLPGFSIGFTHMKELRDHFNGIKLGITLPAYNGKRKVAAANAAAEVAAMQYNIAQVDRIAQIKADYNTATRMATELAQYEALVTDTRIAGVLQRALEGGELTVLDYLGELNYFTEARISYENMLRDYAAALIRINR